VATKKDTTKVTRISASDTAPAKKRAVKGSKSSKKISKESKPKRSFGPIGKFFGYFKGAWSELRQVHWPTRRATWGLTGAVLLFTLFFVILITALDAGFKFLFEQILR
jgi:preprotein translocase subunit SecE